MPDLVLDYHRLKTPIDHPDGSVTTAKIADSAVTTAKVADSAITATKLASLDYITLKGLTADPALAAGRIWFRSDLGQLRYTPDGSTIYVIDPAPVVDKSWSDTTGHYFNTNPSYQYWNALPAIQLDQPASGHKRSFEDTQTGYVYDHGWLLKRNAMLSSRLDIVARVGAYHGYNATRAWLAFDILDDNNLDKKARNDSYPWVRMSWSMSGLGYSNGSYGNPLSGYIVFTNPPSYSFSPANPGVGYNLITSIPNKRWHILYGYGDAWSADWDQWASLQRGVANTNFRYRVATKPPEIEVIRDLSGYVTDAEALIAKWDGEVRLWIRRGERGLIIPLGREVSISGIRRTSRRLSINMFDRVIRSGREPERSCGYIEVMLDTDIMSLHKMGSRWRIVLMDYGDGTIDIALGDNRWDGDKYGYYIHTFS